MLFVYLPKSIKDLPEETQKNPRNSNAELQALIVLGQIGQARYDHIGYWQWKQVVHPGDGPPLAIHILDGQDQAGVGHRHRYQAEQSAKCEI